MPKFKVTLTADADDDDVLTANLSKAGFDEIIDITKIDDGDFNDDDDDD